MDAKLFTKMVTELLSEDGQVVLTDFGTFSTQIVPAHFSDKGFTINPPYLKVCFSSGDESGDALANLYASSNGIDLPQSRALVNDYISHIKKEIADSRNFILPGLGRLRAMSRDNVFFIPQEGLTLFPGYDLLEPVSLKSLAGETPEPSRAAESPEPSSKEQSFREQSSPEPSRAESKDPDPARAGTTVKGGFSFWKLLLILLVIAILLLGVLAVLGRYCPEIVDPLLYDADELKIIRYKF